MKTTALPTRRLSQVVAAASTVLLVAGCATAGTTQDSKMVAAKAPMVGLGAYTQAHAKNPTPPRRLGGTVTVTASQKQGSIRWALPGPRAMDPAVFGDPKHPIGWQQGPFPLTGVSLKLRQQRDGKYTIADHATPFSDWMVTGVGDLNMTLKDVTAIDGKVTEDKISFEATFDAPDKSRTYRVVVDKPMPHGKLFPTFGGVVTDTLLHGGTGIGTNLMPTEYTYAAFWGIGKIYADGRLVNDNQVVHMMITEFVRGDGNKLGFDGEVGAGSTGKVLHLMVPPFKATPKGPVPAPLKSGYIPFPQVKASIMKANKKIMAMPDGPAKKEAVANLMDAKKLMGKTKKRVQEEMAAGRMFGMPFFHVMFGNLKIESN